MRKLILFPAFLAVFLALAISAPATPTQLFTVTVSNTTVTIPPIQAYTYNQPLQNATITHGPLTNLTSLQINIYANYQGATTNGRVFIGTWYPTTTNAGPETISGPNYPITNWLSLDIVTTNSVPLSGSYGQ